MAEAKEVNLVEIGSFKESTSSDGKTQYVATAKSKKADGKVSSVTLAVLGKYQAENIKPGKWMGKFFKNDEGAWCVLVTGKDNPSIAKPDASHGGSGYDSSGYSGGSGASGKERDNLIVAQCAFKGAIDLCAAGTEQIASKDGGIIVLIERLTKTFFDIIMSTASSKVAQPSAAPAAETKPEVPKASHIDILSRNGLLEMVASDPTGIAKASGIWNGCNGNVEMFLATIKQTFGTEKTATEVPPDDDDDLPF